MKKNIFVSIGLVIVYLITFFIQSNKINSLQTALGEQKVDTVVVQGAVVMDTIQTVKVDTVKLVKVKTVVDTLNTTDTVSQTVSVPTPTSGTITFDDNSNPFVGVSGIAKFPSGETILMYKNKLDMASFDSRVRLYYGFGYYNGPFVHATGTMKNVMFGLMTGYRIEDDRYKLSIGFVVGKKI